MKARWSHWREIFFANFWFVPSTMALMALALSTLAVYLDRSLSQSHGAPLEWVWSGGPEGAVAILTTVAGSAITVAGTVFSIVVVALSLASNQLGPRLVRNFMRDTGNQFVLGTFLSTFLYCLLVARTVRFSHEAEFTPRLAVTLALGLGVVSVAVLIYFIHHAAASVQAENILAEIGREFDRPDSEPYGPSQGARGAGVEAIPADFDARCAPVAACVSGYIASVDEDSLAALAAEEDCALRLRQFPGDFATRATALADVYPAARWSEPLAARVNDAFSFGRGPSPARDARYAIHRLVEVAARALSPGVNDPFTAISCIDWLGAALATAAAATPPAPCRCDANGRLRLLVQGPDFDALAAAAIDPLRHYAADSPMVALRLLEMIAKVALRARASAQRETLRRHAERVARQAETSIRGLTDLDAVRERLARVDAACAAVPSPA